MGSLPGIQLNRLSEANAVNQTGQPAPGAKSKLRVLDN